MFFANSTLNSLLAVVLLSLLTAYIVYSVINSPIRHIPGPWHTLITHYPLKYYVLTGQRMYYVHALHARYGPVVRISPSEVAVCDPDGYAAIHRIGGGFLKSAWYEESTRSDSGETSIFAMSDPRQHAQRRKLLGRVLTKQSLRRDWEFLVRQKVERAVDRIYNEAREGGCSDMLKWWTMMSTDTIAQLAFGESFNLLELGESSSRSKTQYATSYPLLHFIQSINPFKSSAGAPDAQKVFRVYGKRAVANAFKNSRDRPNLFARMIDASMAREMEWLNEGVIEAEANSMIIGGSDTTSVTQTYLVWAVLKRPDLREALEEEVDGLEPGFDDAALEKLPLLNAVIDETLRLYGGAPGHLARIVPPKGATVGGYFIPSNYTVETQAYTLHRNPEVWPDPYRFDETRFLDPSQLTQQQKQLFLPFGAGSRSCIGVELAKMELRLATAVFFRRCKGLKLAPGTTDESMEMENYFLISPRGHKCEVIMA
nr:cytochrome p450 [Colletotrichum truncatum]KAF6784938.1 cytochrome p450 [Colletotrichum truncatum]